ncbi:MAG TPA: hypothetical protein VH083_08030 [Myxococcales bacterium]|jgi:hypothetical protein|nr:hypothetical protein [Myxococcales bacterium]
MPSWVLATFLLLSIAFSLAVAFSAPKQRRLFKWILLGTLFVCWLALGAALAQIVARTASTLVTPGGARQPHLLEQTIREGLTLLFSMGGPALFATFVGWLALKASRRKEA